MTDESRSELKTCLETIGDSISYVQFCEKCESWLNSCGDFDSGRRISELSRLPARFVSSVEERAELEKRKRLIIQILDCRHDQARDSVPGENVEDLLEKFATFVQLLNRPAHKKSTFAANPVVLKNELDRLPSSVNGLSRINSASNNAILESGREAPYVQEIAVQRPDFC